MKAGIVKWFDESRGFAFIRAEGVDNDLYCSRQTLERAGLTRLAGGQRVTIDIGPREDGQASVVGISVNEAP